MVYGQYPLNQISELLQEGRIVISDLASEDKTNWTNLESFIGKTSDPKTTEPPSIDELLVQSNSRTSSSLAERLVKKDTASSDNEVGEGSSFFTEENELRTITKPKKNTITSEAKGVVKTPLKEDRLTHPQKKKTLLLISLGLVGVIVVSFTTWILTQDSSTESFEKLVDTKNLNNSESNSVTDKVDISSNQEPALPKEILDTNFKTLSVTADQENQNTNQLNIQQALVDSELKEISDSSNYLIKKTVKDSINPIIRPLL
jgi:hypothetical protein